MPGSLCLFDCDVAQPSDSLEQLKQLAEQVFGNAQQAATWLGQPKQRLGGPTPTPMQAASQTEGWREVRAWLHEIDQGF
jgi:uncharacterized protein (DUF2384 family)